MRKPSHTEAMENPFYFAKLVVALELRRTHGMTFATAFVVEFEMEIIAAACSNAQLRSTEGRPRLH